MKRILLHTAERSIRFPGFLGARLRAGGPNGKNATGMGDAVLINPAQGFFAVGDSSDRDPRAARMFMGYFSDALSDIPDFSSGAASADDRIDDLQHDIVSRSREMLRLFPFQGTSTFTGLLLFRTERRIRAVLFHTGDSILFAYHPVNGVRRITENNFWLLGKVRKFYQVNYFDVNPGERFLFATDGLRDLSPPEGKEFDEYLAELFRRHPVEEIPDILMDSCDTKTDGKDDLAILSLAPDEPFPEICEILLGE
jgi:hypothetical protein